MTEAKAKKGPGRPPAVPMHERPEFKAAVAETAATVVKALLASGAMPAQAVEGAVATAGIDDNTKTLFREMAMSMAEISDQGTQRKRVSPDILAKREAAGVRMFEILSQVHTNLEAARREGDQVAIEAWTPQYRVIAKICFNERVVEPFKAGPDKQPVPNDIFWNGPPSDSLKPLNAIAIKIFGEYKQWLGTAVDLGKTKFAPDNRPVWITAGGLVVKGDPPNKRFVAATPEFENDLSEKANGDPTAPFVHVLGTVAAPARQNTVQGAGAALSTTG